MSAFRNKGRTVRYHHESWAEDSYWTFRAEKTLNDDEAIAARTSVIEFEEYDLTAARAAKREGRRYVPKFSSETKMSGLKAMLLVMSVRWEGSEFIVPDDYPLSDANGEPIVDSVDASGEPVYRLHPSAGQLAPIAEDFIGSMDPAVLEDVETYLEKLYAGRSEAGQKTFREGTGDLER